MEALTARRPRLRYGRPATLCLSMHCRVRLRAPYDLLIESRRTAAGSG